MAVRVRVRIVCNEKAVETSALVNTGYESETPQVLVPVPVAQALGLWPPVHGFEETVFETAGGPLRVLVIPGVCKCTVVSEDVSPPEVSVDLVISPLADEVLLSDKATSELQIAIEDAGKGLWRFRWEPTSKLRRSYPPKYWR